MMSLEEIAANEPTQEKQEREREMEKVLLRSAPKRSGFVVGPCPTLSTS